MSDRVISTQEARHAIDTMRTIIGEGLPAQVRSLRAQGERLMEPQNWDGRLAAEFRARWPEIAGRLEQTNLDLEQLRADVDRINRNIMAAGGNS
jgi:uncharacterized protein YukE